MHKGLEINRMCEFLCACCVIKICVFKDSSFDLCIECCTKFESCTTVCFFKTKSQPIISIIHASCFHSNNALNVKGYSSKQVTLFSKEMDSFSNMI